MKVIQKTSKPVLTFAIDLTEFCEALDGQDLERPALFSVCDIKKNGHSHTQNRETLEGEQFLDNAVVGL